MTAAAAAHEKEEADSHPQEAANDLHQSQATSVNQSLWVFLPATAKALAALDLSCKKHCLARHLS
jgi:hypothetical protein